MATLIQYKNNVPGVKTPIDRTPFHIGRDEENELCIDDALASRRHALLERVTGDADGQSVNFVLRDLDSTNGTFVNHNEVQKHLLVEGDMIRIGQTFFKFTEHDKVDPGDTRILKKSIIPGVYYTSDKK